MKKLALLIGINKYSNIDKKYELHGCVGDSQLIESVIKSRFGFTEDEITRLHDLDATRDNILAAMDQLVEKAEAEDCVFFHYAGHGSRRTSQNNSAGTGKDSTIMTSDSGRSEEFPNLDISDDEIGDWLDALTKKTSNVTLVFDCCHSGTITRDPFADMARSGPADTRPFEEIGIAPRERKLSTTRGAGGFLPRSEHYVVFSGCRDDEYSNEGAMGENGADGHHGALTYNLSKAFLNAGPGSTYRDVFEEIAPLITARYAQQHPQIEGQVDRELMGTDLVSPLKYFVVDGVEADEVTLAGGSAHGVIADSKWNIYPAGTNTVEGAEVVAEMSVQDVSALSSTGLYKALSRAPQVGDRCVLTSAPERAPALVVDFSAVPDAHTQAFEQRFAAEALLTTAAAEAADVKLAEQEQGWTAIAKDGQPIVPFQTMEGDDDVVRLVKNLVTRAQAYNVLGLSNPDSDLSIDFKVYYRKDGEWVQAQNDTAIPSGSRVAFEVTNNGSDQVFINVLDIGLSGAVNAFYPGSARGEPLDPGITIKVGFEKPKMTLKVPADFYAEVGRETFKIIATTNQTSFDWMQQEGTRSLQNKLQGKLAMALTGQTTRDLEIEEEDADWLMINRSFELAKAE